MARRRLLAVTRSSRGCRFSLTRVGSAMSDADRYGRFEIDCAGELRVWLAEHHAQRVAVWLVTFR